ncbi:MAG: hypothetical protein GYA55_05380 [SAR324 cluster bacterium]|uniref:Uncharacterized protein n=1 Tax=SAR324 cluster bacterium TaxID=2024889 RepID=A0A7X9FQU2_9DELT|nr:hypothetical protein [SAR324 cluster bacterium]
MEKDPKKKTNILTIPIPVIDKMPKIDLTQINTDNIRRVPSKKKIVAVDREWV